MIEIVFASGNVHKVEEIGKKLGSRLHVIGLKEIGCSEDIPETQATIEGNARQKAQYIWEKYKRNCFADDTGLEVFALNGEPGVFSARYAGDHKNPEDNLAKLLNEMQSHLNRGARFKTVICCILEGKEYLFEGICEGHISREKRGTQGFGYDPVFIPSGNSRSFAQMNIEDKNILSHRGKAVRLLQGFLTAR